MSSYSCSGEGNHYISFFPYYNLFFPLRSAEQKNQLKNQALDLLISPMYMGEGRHLMVPAAERTTWSSGHNKPDNEHLAIHLLWNLNEGSYMKKFLPCQ